MNVWICASLGLWIMICALVIACALMAKGNDE